MAKKHHRTTPTEHEDEDGSANSHNPHKDNVPAENDPGPVPQKKTKKRKKRDTELDLVVSVIEDANSGVEKADLQSDKKAAKRRRREAIAIIENVEDHTVDDSKGKKRNGADDTKNIDQEPDVSDVQAAESSARQVRKRKKVGDGAERRKKRDSGGEGGEVEGKSKRRKHKAKKDSIDLLDPVEDESLSDQARKSLSYAHLRAVDPANWKFNKARQNWLVRNIWSEVSIPDKYVGLVTGYFTDVQGAVREKLVKSAEAYHSSTADPMASDPEVADGNAKVAGLALQSRARTLLDSLAAER
ncbi:hypothetical protein FA95DRAFT_1611591 [Auriscalpium vulgare]|uniref:Uncharacterized protein n=1 Tax=Auriscalpium vulgare TaxID=40419 RepID=A0ACB8R996_9AGAM|nr:hypothetical protein FA95DRAFT_1611591 [Auriscalpium vulgare]